MVKENMQKNCTVVPTKHWVIKQTIFHIGYFMYKIYKKIFLNIVFTYVQMYIKFVHQGLMVFQYL